MYTKQQSEQFKQIFKRELKYYQTFHGFDLLKFQQDFIPETLENDKLVIKNVLWNKYGEQAVDLIMGILEVNIKSGLNGSLVDLEPNTKSQYQVMHQYSFGNTVPKIVEGSVSYPFAIRKDETNWRLDHLPTGQFIFQGSKSRCEDLLKVLYRDFREKMWSADYSQEIYYEVIGLVGKL